MNPYHKENVTTLAQMQRSSAGKMIDKLHKNYEKFYVHKDKFEPQEYANFSDD